MMKKNPKEGPGLFCLDIVEIENALRSKNTSFEKVELLKHKIEFSNIEVGLEYYSSHSNHSGIIPAIWHGVIDARTANYTDLNDVELNEVYKIGFQQWQIYCQLQQQILNIENKSKIVKLPNHPVPLSNYRSFINGFKAFFLNIDLCNNDLARRNLRCNAFKDDDIFGVAHRAKIEIEILITTQNNGAERLIRKVRRECAELYEESQKLIVKYQLNHANNFPKNQRYFNILRAFHKVYDFLIIEGIIQPSDERKGFFHNVKYEQIDWLSLANSQKPSYSDRLNKYLQGCPECSEMDFISEEVERIEWDIKEPHSPENSDGWRRYKAVMNDYKRFLLERNENLSNMHLKQMDKMTNIPSGEDIDWVCIFESIDLEKELKPTAYFTNSLKEKRNYFSKASFNLTLQYLQNFKKETFLLSSARKLEYLTAMNIVRPQISNSASELFNQTVFEAKSNYYEFLQRYYAGLTAGSKSEDGQILPVISEGIDLSHIRDSKNRFYEGLPMDVVIGHFEIMTKKKSKNGKPFLTQEQLISFLTRGFLNDVSQSKQKINCASGEKGFVIKRFYEFFELAVSQYGHVQRKERFVKLFIDCFDNWPEETVIPFFKPGKTKETW